MSGVNMPSPGPVESGGNVPDPFALEHSRTEAARTAIRTYKGVFPFPVHLLVRPDKPPEKVGSIYVPQTAKDPPCLTGEILAVGPAGIMDGVHTDFTPYAKVGDTVYFKGWGWDEITHDGETLYLVPCRLVAGTATRSQPPSPTDRKSEWEWDE